MKYIGEQFKEKREEIGISISEVSNDLKIDSIIIENLEDGNDKVFKDILELKEMISLFILSIVYSQICLVLNYGLLIYHADTEKTNRLFQKSQF